MRVAIVIVIVWLSCRLEPHAVSNLATLAPAYTAGLPRPCGLLNARPTPLPHAALTW